MNDRMMDIISLKNRLLPGPPTGLQIQAVVFQWHCYDLDAIPGNIWTDNFSYKILGLNAEILANAS